MSQSETDIAALKSELQAAIPALERRKLVWDRPSVLLELIPRYLQEVPFGAPDIISALSGDSDFSYLTLQAFNLSYLVDPIYTAVDCHWIFTHEWQLMLDSARWSSWELSQWHKLAMQDVDPQHKFQDDANPLAFLRSIFASTADPYLKSRAAFFLVHEYGDESAVLKKAYFDAGYEYVPELVDKPEPDEETPVEAPSSPMQERNWSHDFDDFESSDWEDYLGGPDDDDKDEQ